MEPMEDRPPEMIAYHELDRIDALNLPAAGEYKHHYTLVTACLRIYIERICGFPAMDRTTSELVTGLRRTSMKGESIALLHGLLEEANLVKFAKYYPSINDSRRAVSRAREFVDLTRPDRAAPQARGAESERGPQEGTDL